MAEEIPDEENEEIEPQEGSKKGRKLLLVIVVLVLLLVAAGGAAYVMLGTDKQAAATGESGTDEDGEPARKNAFYFSLDPAFVVNFQGKSRARYLQVNIDGMPRQEGVKLDVTKHLPQIRNNVVLLLSSQDYESLIKPEGKDSLRKSLLKEINKILEEETGNEDAVENIYFTNFVMQ